MARDLALDPITGDFLFTSVRDYQIVEGNDVVQQRIMTRLKMSKGWVLDPTNGSLGSRLKLNLRAPRGRVLREIPLMIQEALSPMTDVSVQDVTVEEYSPSSLLVHIDYQIFNPIVGTPIGDRPALRLTFPLQT